MRHRLVPPSALLPILLLASSCSDPARRQVSVDSSPIGLASFFTNECVQQRGASVARRVHKDAKQACGGDGRCLDDLPNEAGWAVTTRDGQSIAVTYDWRGLDSRDPPDGFLGCSIAVSNALKGNLRGAIALLRIDGNRFRSVEAGYARPLIDIIETWRIETPRPTPMVLTLQHFMSPNAPENYGAPPPEGTFERGSYDRGVASAEAELAAHADHPWQLKIGVERNQP